MLPMFGPHATIGPGQRAATTPPQPAPGEGSGGALDLQPLVIVADRIAQEGLDLLSEQCRVEMLRCPRSEDALLARQRRLEVVERRSTTSVW